MGKYAMTRSHGSARSRGSSATEPVNDNGWNHFRYLFGDFGIFGIKPFQLYDTDRYMSDYLRNRGLTWSDMLYPSIAPKAPNTAGVWRTSEKALKRLYK